MAAEQGGREPPKRDWEETTMRRITAAVAVAAALAAVLGPVEGSARETSKTIFGYVERVVVSAEGFSLKAKLDTGAETSSLDARNIKRIRRGGERLVRFDVPDPETGQLVTLERPLARIVRIRQNDGPYERRPVVHMWLCIGHLAERVEVNLVDRGEFAYPLLIGRSVMRGAIIVDPELTFTTRPRCDPTELSE
jgi:hypothetical protein